MRAETIWDFWASRYERLLVQKLALTPVRNAVLNDMEAYVKGRTAGTGIKILDMGCGTGQMIREMDQVLSVFKPEITGVDLSQNMIDEALKKNTTATFFCGDAEHYQPGRDRYDIIVCLNSFPYYRDQEKVLENFRRMLKKGGMLILAQASINTFYDRLAMAVVKLTVSRSRYLSIPEMNRVSKKVFHQRPSTTKVPVKWFMPTLCKFVWIKE